MWSTFNLSNIFSTGVFLSSVLGTECINSYKQYNTSFWNHIKFGVLFKAKDLIFFSGILIIGKLYLDSFVAFVLKSPKKKTRLNSLNNVQNN